MQKLDNFQSKSNHIWDSRLASFECSAHEHQAGNHGPELLQVISQLEIASVLDFFKHLSDCHILDVGAGGGRWSIAFADKVCSVTSLEPSSIVSILEKRLSSYANARVFNVSLEEFESDRSYDIVIIYGTLMYLTSDEHVISFLSKISSLISPGGYLVLGEALSESRKFVVDWEIIRQKQEFDGRFNKCNYWEVLRDEDFYVKTCLNNQLILNASFLGHAPFFYHLPINNKLLLQMWRAFVTKIVNIKYFSYLKMYNNCARKLSEYLLKKLDKRYMKIFIFKKRVAQP